MVAPVFFDSSVLIRGIVAFGAAADASQVIMDRLAEGRVRSAHTAWHCCLEFYAVTTRLPEELRISPDVAARIVREEILGRMEVHDLPEKSRADFFCSVEQERISGGRIYDAHIGETALRAGVRMFVTNNLRHFLALTRHQVRVVSASEFLKLL